MRQDKDKASDKVFIQGVSVCVGYAAVLEFVAENNNNILDRWIICTTEEDKDTINICKKYNLEYYAQPSDKYKQDWDSISENIFKYIKNGSNTQYWNNEHSFNKGLAINDGLHKLEQKGWILHIDSDILLPLNIKEVLAKLDLKKDFIYGTKRINITSVREIKPFSIDQNNVSTGNGRPLGYFQLFHSSEFRFYDEFWPRADMTDLWFQEKWKGKNNLLDFEVIHLGENGGGACKNKILVENDKIQYKYTNKTHS